MEVPAELLESTQKARGEGITQTVRTGLQLVAAAVAHHRIPVIEMGMLFHVERDAAPGVHAEL